MVSTQASYMRGVSPPKYRRQTLQVFDVYGDHKSDYTQLPPRPASALDRKWVHRSLGDLTSDADFMNSHPRLQTNFYQDLIRKYPQAFNRRREARENGRRLFNSRPHVRFEDEEKLTPQKSRSVLSLYKSDNELTNWDREVGPYIRRNTRECMTSVDPSECSGSVLSLKQRLHLNSLTLNKLLNEKSPLRKKFERDKVYDDSGTENEQSLEDYFLDKSRRRSRNRVKHRKVLQRRIDNNAHDKEQTSDMGHRQRMSKSVSPTHKHMYSLPTHHPSRNVNVDSVTRDSDLKIDTLLEKINSKMSGPESPPDSAIDVDTPSVQSFMSSEKVMTSDNVYHVTIDLDDKNKDFESESSPESSPSVYASNRSGRSHDDTSASVKISAMNTNHSISRESQISVTISDDERSKLQGTLVENVHDESNLTESCVESLGLLQLCPNQLRTDRLGNKVCQDQNKKLNEPIAIPSDKTKLEQDPSSDGEQNLFQTDMTTMIENMENTQNPTASGATPRSPDNDRKCNHGNQDKNEEWRPLNESISTLPPRGRHKQRETTSSMLADHRVLPNRADLDSSILDEIHLDKLSHDLSGRQSHSDNIDDTDIRLGIPKVTSRDAKIAEKYRRTRSPSPFILTNRRLSLDRPKSAPSLSTEDFRMRLVEIPYAGESVDTEGLPQPNTPIEIVTRSVHKTCQKNDIRGVAYDDFDLDDDASRNERCKVANAANKSCVQTCDSTISTSSSPPKHRNGIVMAIDSVEASIASNEEGNSVIERDTERKEAVVDDHTKINCNLYLSHNSANKTIYDNEINDHTKSIACANPHSDVNKTPNNQEANVRPQTFVNHTLNNGNLELVEHPQTQIVSAKRGNYKPSTSSPRVKEKKIKLKSLLKNKRGSFSPYPADEMLYDDKTYNVQGEEKQLHPTEFDESLTSHSDNPGDRMVDDYPIATQCPTRVSCETTNGERLDDSDLEFDPPTVRSKPVSEIRHQEQNITDVKRQRNGFNSPDNISIPHRGNNAPSRQNKLYSDQGNNSSSQETSHSPKRGNESSSSKTSPSRDKGNNSSNPKTSPSTDKGNNSSSQESLPRTSHLPPTKPVRQKHKKLPDVLDLSNYKIMPNGQEMLEEQESLPYKQGEATQHNVNSEGHDESRQNGSKPLKTQQEPIDRIEAIEPQVREIESVTCSHDAIKRENMISNLEATRPMSASKGSLLGGFKSATKGKLKSLKKAMSLERGMDKAGVASFPDPNNQVIGGPDNSGGNAKMKKAPSLKSIASLFGRKKKKKGKFVLEDAQSSSAQTSGSENSKNRKAHTNPGTSTSRPIGKLRSVNSDGTQIVQLMKPASGPIGFFIAKGSAKFKNGMFISRFSDPHPEKVFGGLLSIGDEILEVNGHFVRDLSQDDVYNIISASPIVVMKVFPFIARNDV